MTEGFIPLCKYSVDILSVIIYQYVVYKFVSHFINNNTFEETGKFLFSTCM